MACSAPTPPRIGLFYLTTETLEIGRRLADLSFMAQQRPCSQLSHATARLEAIAKGAEDLARLCRELIAASERDR